MGKSRLAHAPLGQRPQALAGCLHREDQSSPFDWHEALVFVEADEAVVQSIDNDEFARHTSSVPHAEELFRIPGLEERDPTRASRS